MIYSDNNGLIRLFDGTVVYIDSYQYSSDGVTNWESTFQPFTHINPNNPTQLSQTIIGDSRTTSAILTNPKALLFSKEKQLLAIPVNNYSEDFEIDSSIDSYSSIVDSYTNYNKSYVSEGYFVYKININNSYEADE